MIEIKNRFSGEVIFTFNGDSLVNANLRGAYLRSANLSSTDLSGANLSNANLHDADLGYANLRGANLRGANLGGANLGGAYLSSADLGYANLRGANLRGADLGGANLRSADLRGAYLSSAYLRSANLGYANLDYANLRDANLRPIRDDFYAVLSAAPAEVPALLEALRAGKIDGSTYSGDCACLVGTIANARKCDVNSLGAITPDQSRPAERWFLALQPGDTPKNHPVAKIVEEWTKEFMAK